ncbi:hypothetical protein ES332_A10G130100v1, partial [Gossypium tomentosum]
SAQSNGCSGESGKFSTNRTYSQNLDLILSTLPSSDPDKIYALALCRGDIASGVCFECINSSIEGIIKQCPNQKEAIYWGPGISSSIYQFNETFPMLMEILMKNASSGSKFATGNMNFTDSEKVYGLVQCTPDISETDCRICLQRDMVELSECCGKKQGGRVLRPSCIAWFELSLFYDSSSIDTPSPTPFDPPLTPSFAPPEATRNKVPTVVLLAFVIGSISCGMLYMKKFTLSVVKAATGDFHDDNKLGQGGFGSVYKGKLKNGQEIAVKRLSKHSSQGELEFRNEILLVAKLQHRNLVSLLGFCLEGTERILVYEYVSNGSLDQFIFATTSLFITYTLVPITDSIKRGQLNWEMCYKIICGIARGILYLHEDSRLKIIHRDLKASNVLLDEEMNPKITDFGLARLFSMNQIQGNTHRTVGTYGYMVLEYAVHGQFSVKCDIFSLGVLLLETVIGKRNSWMNDSGEIEHLPSHTWKNWKEGTSENLINPMLRNSSNSKEEIIRCNHIGLLCVQELAAKRPTMASVVLMLNTNSLSLPLPLQPAFLMYGNISEAGLSTSDENLRSNQPVQSTDSDATP